MWDEQYPFRQLYEALLEHEGTAHWNAVVVPWLEANADERAWVREFGQRGGEPVPPASSIDLCRLYALNRVVELLALRFQQGNADRSPWPGPAVDLAQFETFAMAFGMTVLRPSVFSPFHHEVVEVVPEPEMRAPVRVLEFLWPCLMLGPMLFFRAGVRVGAGYSRTASPTPRRFIGRTGARTGRTRTFRKTGDRTRNGARAFDATTCWTATTGSTSTVRWTSPVSLRAA